MKRILVLNGPNLNLLGLREPELYGREDYAALERFIRAAAQEAGAAVTIRQSNFEGELVTWVQQAHGVFDANIGGLESAPTGSTLSGVSTRSRPSVCLRPRSI